MKIAWGFTGAGHLLRESVEIAREMLILGHTLDFFISNAAENVLKMYGLFEPLINLKKEFPDTAKHYHLDRDQPLGYPICGKFNLGKYQCLILSPLSANSVAKMVAGIADTLITNIFSQMVKGGGEIFAVPCDLIPGELETAIPGGGTVKIHVDAQNSRRALALKQYPNVSVFETPNAVLNLINNREK